MATMYSRCYISITIHGNEDVDYNMYPVSFGGPTVKHSCSMDTQCMQNSFCNWHVMSEREWNSAYNHRHLCRQGWRFGYIHCWAGLRLHIHVLYRTSSIHSVKSEIIAAYISTEFIHVQLLMVLVKGIYYIYITVKTEMFL